MTGASRQSRATLKLRLFSSRPSGADGRVCGDIRDREDGADAICRDGAERGVNPTTASPAVAAARTPESESSKATIFRASPRFLERGQTGQKIVLGARQLAADSADRLTLREASTPFDFFLLVFLLGDTRARGIRRRS